MFSTVLRVGVFLSLCFFNPSKIDGDQIFLFHFLMGVVILSLFAKKLREVDMRLLGVFSFTALASLVLNFHWPVRLIFINLFVGVMAIKAIAECYDFDVKKTGVMIISFCFVNSVLIFLQNMKSEFYYYKYFNEVAGVMWRPWMLGCAGVLVLPFLIALSPIFSVLAVPMLLYSQSKSCIFAALIVFLVASKVKLTWTRAGIVIALLNLYVVFADVYFDPSRIIAWVRSIKYIHNPFVGNGIGAWAHEGFIRWNGATPEHWVWAHNEFYQVFFEQGHFGFLSLVVFTGYLIYKNRKDSIKLSLIIAMIILSSFHPIFRFGKLLGILVLILSWLLTDCGLKFLSSESSNTISKKGPLRSGHRLPKRSRLKHQIPASNNCRYPDVC